MAVDADLNHTRQQMEVSSPFQRGDAQRQPPANSSRFASPFEFPFHAVSAFGWFAVVLVLQDH